MSRTVTGAVDSALAAPNAAVVIFVELLLASGAVRACSAGADLTWNGYTWPGVGALGTVEETRENTSREVSGLRFQLSGVPPAMLAVAMNEAYQGRTVNLYVGVLALPTYAVLADPVLEWSGLIDVMTVVRGSPTGTVSVSAESELFDFERPKALLWSNEEQQRLFAGDKGLEYVAQLADRPIIWPSKEFFRK